MIVKVFIPTYKRLNSLQAVLYSLLKAELPDISFSYQCYILNNYPANKALVDQVAANAKENSGVWVINVIHRVETIPPIKNWYGAITEYTNDGEIAFLHGDDDIFMPDSISFRVNSILQHEADLLLTTQAGDLFFYDASTLISIDNCQFYSTDPTIKQVSWQDNKWPAIFIGNNIYRMTPSLRAALIKAMGWCEAQDWLSFDNRTLMYPIYIPLAIILLGGKVISSEKNCVIRGMNIEETRAALWGTPGWNSGFLHLAYMGVLNNSDLRSIKALDSDRLGANNYVALWFWTFFLDPRISRKIRKRTIREIGTPKFTFQLFISSIVFILKGLLSQYKIYHRMKDIVRPKKIKIEAITFINSLTSKE